MTVAQTNMKLGNRNTNANRICELSLCFFKSAPLQQFLSQHVMGSRIKRTLCDRVGPQRQPRMVDQISMMRAPGKRKNDDQYRWSRNCGQRYS